MVEIIYLVSDSETESESESEPEPESESESEYDDDDDEIESIIPTPGMYRTPSERYPVKRADRKKRGIMTGNGVHYWEKYSGTDDITETLFMSDDEVREDRKKYECFECRKRSVKCSRMFGNGEFTCPVCLESMPLSDGQFFRCGHIACTSCVQTVRNFNNI